MNTSLTMNNIGMVPALGICANKGEKKQQMKKQSPAIKVDRPVLAPSFNPTPVSGDRIIGGPVRVDVEVSVKIDLRLGCVRQAGL